MIKFYFLLYNSFSDGSGRAGTFATVYIALERMKLESIVDVFSIVRNVRAQRIGMVENLVGIQMIRET